MQVIVKCKGTTLTQPLRDYAEHKLSHLSHFFDNIQKIEIMLEVDRIKENEQAQAAHATAWTAGKILRASSVAPDLYTAIDLVIDKLAEQIKKHKEKMIQEQRRHAPEKRENAWS